MIEPDLLTLLVCPATGKPLYFDSEKKELISLANRCAYPIRDGIPILMEAEARMLDDHELEQLRKRYE